MAELDPEWTVIVLCGIGTFLLRFVPLWWQSGRELPRAGFMHLLSDMIGPAAVAALLVAMLWPMLVRDGTVQNPLPVIMGLFGVWAMWRCRGGIALATLCGAACYGAVAALLAH